MQKSIVQLANNLMVASDSINRPANTTAYVAGDAVSEETTNNHFVLKGIVRPGQNSGTIKRAKITSSANVGTKPDLELWLFNQAISETADNAAFAPSDAQLDFLIGVIPFPTGDFIVGNAGVGAAGNTVCFADTDIPFSGVTVNSLTGAEIYGQLVIRNGYIPVSSEIFKTTLLVATD